MKNTLLFLFLICTTCTGFSQRIVNLTFIKSFTITELDSAINSNGIPPAFVGTQHGVDIYKVIYNTVSYDSTATTASGMVAFPRGLNCILPLVSYQHSPETRKIRVPSRLFGNEPLIVLALASNGYIACAPDYLGLGDGEGFHPFLHAQSEATATIDLLRAARELSDSLGVRYNSEIFLSGYSQGGHAALATHKYIQQHLAGEMSVTASFPMSGPYDMDSIMFNAMFVDTTYPQKAFVALLFCTYNNVYHLYDSLSQVMVSPYDMQLPPLFDGTQPFWTANTLITGPANSIFKPDTLAAWISNPNHPFRIAMRKNSLADWAPTSTTKMFFCSSDDFVPYENATSTFFKMHALGSNKVDTQNVNTVLTHEGCAQFAILAAKLAIDNVSTIDCSTGINNVDAATFTVVPNPANNLIRIQSVAGTVKTVSIADVSGKQVFYSATEMSTLDVSQFEAGTYFVHIKTTAGRIITRKLVKK